MPGLEDALAFKELGTAAVFLIVFYIFAEAYRKDFFRQLDQANKRGEDSQKEFMIFINVAFKENTKALSELVMTFKEHTTSKDNAMRLLEERYRKEER